MIKKLIAFTTILAVSICGAANDLYSLIRPEDGYHYISIDQNLESFSFDVLKYENASLNGHTGYFVYSEDMTGKTLENYIKENGVDIAKNQTTVDVGSLDAGDKIGFYKWELSGHGWNQKRTIDTGYIIGTKIVSRSTDWHGNVTETILDEGTFVDYISGSSYQSGNGGWMKIEITAIPASGNSTSGAPLPGALAIMFVGGISAYSLKKNKKRI